MSFSTIIKSPLFFIGLPFVLFLGVLFFGLSFLNENGNGKNKIKIKPVITVAQDLSECLESDQAITVKIVNPTNNKEFNFNDQVSLKGQVDFKCKDLLKANEYQIKPTWYLDDGKSPVSSKLNHTLSNLSSGDHSISLEVAILINDLDDLNTGATAEFKVKGEVLGVTPTPPVFVPTVAPTQVPNAAPTATISSPNDGFNASATYTNFGCRATVGVRGSGSDPEDGVLPGTSLQWSFTNISGTRINVGTGTSQTIIINTSYSRTPTVHYIYLVATDSDGATNQKEIKITVDSYSCG